MFGQSWWTCAKPFEVVDWHYEMAGWRFLERDCLTSGRKYNLHIPRTGNIQNPISGVHDRPKRFKCAETQQTGEVIAGAFDDWRLQGVEPRLPIAVRNGDWASHLKAALLRPVTNSTHVEWNGHLLLCRSVAVAKRALC